MYANNGHVDGEVLQGTLNVIGCLSMSPEKRLEAELQIDAYRMRTGTYSNSQLQYVVEESAQLREKCHADDTSGQIDVDALFDDENPLQSWVENDDDDDDPSATVSTTTGGDIYTQSQCDYGHDSQDDYGHSSQGQDVTRLWLRERELHSHRETLGGA
ncbi:hypothetical protein Taro_010836 [Colocasia esculenta]|uniref:Uncharacterized protein n=1 Tax=Colocasia esculenta TaxID=4460 RepID=A0A843TZZ4_COLES|nr:hypothetical protein [Colocasia esculenta]